MAARFWANFTAKQPCSRSRRSASLAFHRVHRLDWPNDDKEPVLIFVLSGAPFPPSGGCSNASVPFVAAVFPIAAKAAGDLRKAVGDFDAVHIFRVLVAELALDA